MYVISLTSQTCRRLKHSFDSTKRRKNQRYPPCQQPQTASLSILLFRRKLERCKAYQHPFGRLLRSTSMPHLLLPLRPNVGDRILSIRARGKPLTAQRRRHTLKQTTGPAHTEFSFSWISRFFGHIVDTKWSRKLSDVSAHALSTASFVS